MKDVAQVIHFVLKLLVFGLVVRMVLSWIRSPSTRKYELMLDKVYEPALRPIRGLVRPIQLNTSPPTALDLAPLILMLLIWWVVYPLVNWFLT